MALVKSYYAETQTGEYLELNEDAVIAEPSVSLYGIIDGYGGSGIGDKITELIKETVIENYGILSQDEDSTLPLYFEPNYSIETNALINVLKLSHSKVIDLNSSKDSNSRGAASFLGCISKKNSIQLVGTGNCLALKISKDSTSIVFFPHSNFEGSIIGTPDKNSTPYSGIGLLNEFEFFVREVKVNKKDKIILLSSGCYAAFNFVELAILLKESKSDPKIFKNELCQLANARGSKSNQSIVCLEF